MRFSSLHEQVFFALCKQVDTPSSLAHWLAFKYRSSDLFALKVDPKNYDSSYSFSRDYLVSSWVSKVQVEAFGFDTRAAAIAGLDSDESYNRRTNERLWQCWTGAEMTPTLSLLLGLRRKMSELLGPFCLRDCLEGVGWSGGATNTLSRAEAHPTNKIAGWPLSVTSSAHQYLKLLVESSPAWLASLGLDVSGPASLLRTNFAFVEHDAVDVVPKSAKTGRTISKQGTGNLYLQKGVRKVLLRRLRRVGVDLKDQGHNQRRASQALKAGYATLDLKSASNSMTVKLMEIILPTDWFHYLDAIRHRTGLWPGETAPRKWALFSTMGNGFTFELESMVFYAICSLFSSDVSIYGDDLIVPARKSAEIIEALELLGFRLNSDKTHVNGRFYESCGEHFFDGTQVTPVYQKEHIDAGNLGTIVRAHNRLMRWALRSGSGHCLDSSVRPAVNALRRHIHPKLAAPLSYLGDDAYLSEEWNGRRLYGVYNQTVLRYGKIPLKTNVKGAVTYSLHKLEMRPDVKHFLKQLPPAETGSGDDMLQLSKPREKFGRRSFLLISVVEPWVTWC